MLGYLRLVSCPAFGLGEPEGLAFGSNGDLFVAGGTSDRIYEITPSGTVSTFASSNFDAPVGLAIDSSGNIFAGNQFNGTIVEFTPGGSSTTFASGLSTPDHLAFDSSGNLWASDANGCCVWRVVSSRSTIAARKGMSIHRTAVNTPTRSM
jgi:sugar lactone lactonase YvrE